MPSGDQKLEVAAVPERDRSLLYRPVIILNTILTPMYGLMTELVLYSPVGGATDIGETNRYDTRLTKQRH